jgi:putative DNA primase/helicase
MKFQEFNQVVNPSNEPCYIVSVYGQLPRTVTFDEVNEIAKKDTSLEVSWIIPEGFVVIETRAKQLVDSIKKHNMPILVVENSIGLQIICKHPGKINNTTNNVLACGVNANIRAHSKVQSPVLLPFKRQGNTSENVAKLNIVHSNGIEEIPTVLRPIRKISSPNPNGLEIPIVSNEKIVLHNLLRDLKSLSKAKQVEVIKFVNTELCINPLNEMELNAVLELNESAFTQQFFDKDKFLHHKLGDHLIESCNIKQDKKTKQLFYFNEKKKIYTYDPDYLLGYMTKLAPSLKDFQKQEVMKYITNYLYDEAVTFNNNPYTIVFKNGILNIATGKFSPMSPEFLESIQVGANYNPNLKHNKVADEFFYTATVGNTEVAELLYEAIGYAMLKTAEMQKFFILIGSGRNGKSTYLDLAKAIVGDDNSASLSMKDLQNTFRPGMLLNKLASFAADISNQPIQDSDMIKSIASGDAVTLEEKYKSPVSGSTFATLFYAANSLPGTPDTSEGFYRRMVIIPFLADLKKISHVDGLKFKENLLQQEVLDYVATQAVNAISRVMNETKQFTEPNIVKEILKEYRYHNSSVLSWWREDMKENMKRIMSVRYDNAYEWYAEWIKKSGRKGQLNLQNFKEKLKVELNIDLTANDV